MKKLESLSLNKFKAYELKKESHNSLIGGKEHIGETTRGTNHCIDRFDEATAYRDAAGTITGYPGGDVARLNQGIEL